MAIGVFEMQYGGRSHAWCSDSRVLQEERVRVVSLVTYIVDQVQYQERIGCMLAVCQVGHKVWVRGPSHPRKIVVERLGTGA